jgi:hypothetical protein
VSRTHIRIDRRVFAVERKPDEVWCVPGDAEPPADLPLMHGLTAWMQDIGHDWRWHDGALRYSGTHRDGGAWLVLVYESEAAP